MLKGFVGTKELQESVSEIKQELPAIQSEIIRQVREDMKSEFTNAVQAYEMRMKASLKEMFDSFKESHNPNNVVYAIEEREASLEKEREREEIKKQLSVIYSLSKEADLFEQGKRGAEKFTKEGDLLYKNITTSVMRLAKYHGSKSHTKIANPTTYELFMKTLNIDEPLRKVYVNLNNGKPRHSVYADIIKRGLTARFVKFLEDEFLNEKESI